MASVAELEAGMIGERTKKSACRCSRSRRQARRLSGPRRNRGRHSQGPQSSRGEGSGPCGVAGADLRPP
jgi:hypothetical protein